MNKKRKITPKAILTLLLLASCTPSIYRIADSGISPQPDYGDGKNNYTLRFTSKSSSNDHSFSYTNKEGKTIFFSEAQKDSITGETISLRHLGSAVISAKSNHIAEREGSVTLSFVITVPSALLNSNWQTIITPVLLSGSHATRFKDIIISGKQFKSSQIKGYKKYLSYINKIIDKPESDLTCFTRYRDLANFLERNLPQSGVLYGQKDSLLQTSFGVKENEIIQNYLKRQKITRNRKRIENKPNAFRKYVKTPFLKNCRLDSLIKETNGNFLYYYSQEVNTLDKRPELFLWLETRIRSTYGSSIKLSCSDTIKYKTTSISTLADTSTRYLKKIIQKRVQFHFKTNFIFPLGEYKLDTLIEANRHQIKTTDSILSQITKDSLYSPYKVKIISYSSPDGKFRTNKILSKKRANTISQHITSRLSQLTHIKNPKRELQSVPENWAELRKQIAKSQLPNKDKLIEYFKIPDPDERENALKREKRSYNYIKKHIYPLLRNATVTIYLSRNDMIQDTIHTKEPDTLYMKALKYLKEKRYNKAADILDRYRDINTALTYISMGNYTVAATILEENPPSALKYYLKAILLARKGKEQEAATLFIKAKELDITMAYRGRLDPEINHLIIKYNLNKDLFE